MKLTELSPRWLINENIENNGKKWLLFKSSSGAKEWITCKNFIMSIKEQYNEIYRLCPDLVWQVVVGCQSEMCWSMNGNLENLTVKPSIDASKSGNWHGFITNGEIT